MIGLKSEKCGITYNINHNFSRIRSGLYNSLPIYSLPNIFLEKCLYEDKSNAYFLK